MRSLPTLSREARRRVLVQDVEPDADGDGYAVKRCLGDRVMVSCDLVCDGSDALAGALLHRGPTASDWSREPLEPLGNDRYAASFVVGELGAWTFAVQAWVDPVATWRAFTRRKLDAGQDIETELAAGALLLQTTAARADGKDAALLAETARSLSDRRTPQSARLALTQTAEVIAVAARHPDRADATTDRERRLCVDPVRARFSSWYEMFPRSAGATGEHGTLRDCALRLPYVRAMGFDVLYLPPIHPIGRTARKGRNNAAVAEPDDVGSPWAIGSAEGGHKAVHPRLGTLDDFRLLVQKARELGIDVAIDLAFQASPDHPYVAEHPEWFRHRPDGSIQYAENPPKKYEDVYPFDFECSAWESLWRELLDVTLFWCQQGVRVFRVDNPHTKPISFWRWCIASVKERHPEVLFLAEAFTRPKLMYALARAGFSQSYTYFAWRHSKSEFVDYLRELTRAPVSDFYRPNFWPNTPDILTEHLQFGGRAAFVQRLVLAATLASSYGIYGPPFELMEHVARPGSEEYADNEKYQVRRWPLEREDSLRDLIALVNRIRAENPALQDNRLTFHEADDEQLLVYSKRSADGENVVLVVVNLDVHRPRAGRLQLDLAALGVRADEDFQVHDLLTDARYHWRGSRPSVEIDPALMPAAIYRLRRRIRTERDFDYFL